MMQRPLILASQSAIRRQLLSDAGLAVTCRAALCDEDHEKRTHIHLSPADLAGHLASAKAVSVFQAADLPDGAVVIGADQTLSCAGQMLHKAVSVADAADKLRQLRGRTHTLHSAVAVAMAGQVVWQHVDDVQMRMRDWSDDFLAHYLAHAGGALTRSVGAYEYEGLGVQLFDRVEGSQHAILGLPLLPLLAALRRFGVVLS